MVTKKMSFNSNPNVGLYGYATDNYVLVGYEVPEKELKELERIFGVPVHRISIAGTSLLGVFLVGTNELLLVPPITFDYELEKLKKLGINYKVFETDLTCLGNNIVLTEHGILVNPEFDNAGMKKLKSLFNLPIKKLSVFETDALGAVMITRSGYCLLHRDASSQEIKIIEETLKVKVTTGTVNMGSPYIRTGMLCNKNGLIVGDISGGPEIVNAEEALGFLD
ncbi:MAG: translation initiation factor IF-6 [Nanoarchaeota archaeon]|nr:translation initiation factor IF-6 [Nanoarchaeota archaeon]MBU1031071.1 translation initiation factor IF-6 [Nanoarchaeota archaeon]MBU1850494.1 translation initiation factor IF-6 [Nanoarchaeota archaeon]